jgi:hypothetical protein
MARYAGGGKNTVDSCRSIDVLRWNKAEERSTIGLMGFVERLGRRTSRRA